jgi:putative peptidoglycan lipid II flippase
MIGNQQQQEARNSLNLALGLVLILSVPMTIALIAFRSPIVRLLFEHGAFTNEATNEVGQVLIFYALAVFADAICQPFWRVVYALRGGRTVVMVNAVQTLIRLTINLLMIPFLGYNGLSVSAFIGLGVQAVLLAYLAYKNLNWRVNRQMLAYTGQVILIGVIALAGVWLSNDWLLKIQPEPSPLNYLLLIGSLFFVAYTGILVVVSKPYRIYQEALRGN